MPGKNACPTLISQRLAGLEHVLHALLCLRAAAQAEESFALEVQKILLGNRLLARDASADAALDVARVLAPELGWSEAEVESQAASYRAAMADERAAGGLQRRASTRW